MFDIDLEGNMPIHVAIDFNRKGVFKVMLDQLINAGGVSATSIEEQNPPFEVLDKLTSELSLASRCVIKQAWYCLAELVRVCGVNYVKAQSDTHLIPRKLAQDYAEECDLLQEYEQIIAWFETEQNGQASQVTLQAILETITAARYMPDEDTFE